MWGEGKCSIFQKDGLILVSSHIFFHEFKVLFCFFFFIKEGCPEVKTDILLARFCRKTPIVQARSWWGTEDKLKLDNRKV